MEGVGGLDWPLAKFYGILDWQPSLKREDPLKETAAMEAVALCILCAWIFLPTKVRQMCKNTEKQFVSSTNRRLVSNQPLLPHACCCVFLKDKIVVSTSVLFLSSFSCLFAVAHASIHIFLRYRSIL